MSQSWETSCTAGNPRIGGGRRVHRYLQHALPVRRAVWNPALPRNAFGSEAIAVGVHCHDERLRVCAESACFYPLPKHAKYRVYLERNREMLNESRAVLDAELGGGAVLDQSEIPLAPA
jgi:hypothetical protein